MPSSKEIAEEITKKIEKLIANEINNKLPKPSCPLQQKKILWKREEVRKYIILGLGGDAGLTTVINVEDF